MANIKAIEYKRLVKEIKDHYKAKGYKPKGQGSFGIVFTKKNDAVKVLIPKPAYFNDDDFDSEVKKNNKVSDLWTKFVAKNKNNPHFPKYRPTTSIRKMNQSFQVVQMETLKELNEDESSLIEHVVFEIRDRKRNAKKALEEIYKDMHSEKSGYEYWAKNLPEYKMDFKEFSKHFKQLFEAIEAVNKEANRSKIIDSDIEANNFMVRVVGGSRMIVINDPWMVAED
jgi:hypothetical protein